MRKVDFYGISRLSFDQIFRMIVENTLYRILDKIFIYRFISYIIFRRRKIFLSEKEIISRRFRNMLCTCSRRSEGIEENDSIGGVLWGRGGC